MTWIVDVEVINPYGICTGEGLSRENYTPFAGGTYHSGRGNFQFRFHQSDLYSDRGYEIITWYIIVPIGDNVRDYVRRVNNLSDDIEIETPFVTAFHLLTFPDITNLITVTNKSIQDQRDFETETEALEYVDSLENPAPIRTTIRTNESIFRPTWREQIDGIWVDRHMELIYTGDDVTLYTLDDLVNFFALFLGITSEEIWDKVEYEHDRYDWGSLPTPDNPPAFGCETYLKATIIDADGLNEPTEVDIDFTGSSIGDVTVTTIDGDPNVTLTEIVNGDGSVTIHDNGNIIMSNDGGTFFLNEFGNVGFYANNDASLTANTQVQLGVGGTSVTVENDCFTFRDGTGNVELTADELTRLKALLD